MQIQNCPTCGQVVDGLTDEKLIPIVKAAIENYQTGSGYYRHTGWEIWEEATLGTWHDVPELGTVTCVANTRNYRGYDETDQGGEAYYIVLEMTIGNEKKYFRQDFHFDSYGENRVVGPLKVAHGTTKTVTIFE